MTTRLQNWPEHLNDWIEEVRGRPFEWGLWDCVTAAAQAVHRITGEWPDLGASHWATQIGALRVISEEGGLEAAVTKRFGEPIGPQWAQRGDLVLAEQVDEPGADPVPVLAVCVGADFCGPTPRGLRFRPMTEAIKAWKVGRG